MLIADVLGIAVNYAFEHQYDLTAMEIIIVMLSYTFQIYFDFSGYCDMAVGIGKMYHIDLPINFNSPYKATSIIEFWQRWHLTLTRFLKKYIYIPLGGNRKGKRRTYINILIVFVVSGIWHGANWTFILWGTLHGVANVFNRMFEKYLEQIPKIFKWICTFAFINCMWLLFRSESVSQAIFFFKRICLFRSIEISQELKACYSLIEINGLQKIFGLNDLMPGMHMWLLLVLSLVICVLGKNVNEKEFKPTLVKAITAPLLLIWSIASFSGVSTFLYFNF